MFLDNLTGFMFVITVFICLVVIAGTFAHAGMHLERRFRKRGATRIARWVDRRDARARYSFSDISARIEIACGRPWLKVRHLARDPAFIPQWLRAADPPAKLVEPDRDFVPEHLRITHIRLLRKQAD